ncbi:MAG TPA: dihydrodipicolinate synthase family protein [candidate division Zixibacteria bacterium]|nr:dihydrodipicolinate synthase family protein [candidate division Zixibacteria bacterium]
MITASELNGVLAMMPAFATPDAVDIRATQTIAVDNLKEAVDKIIKDGVHNIATTGTYGECYNLLFDEFRVLAAATTEAVNKRVPLFIGCTSPNPREVVQKMNFVKDLGADGVLLGVPYYETLPVADAIRFYHDIADLFPTLAIVIYHNPENHKFTIPVAAFKELVKKPNIVGMKDSHRTTQAFMSLQKIIKGKISVFVNQTQLYPYYQLGAAGCWSTEVWMGPWPVLYLLDVVRRGDVQKAIEVIDDLIGDGSGGRPVPGAGNKRPAEFADYCKVGPTRVPFLNFPEAELAKAKRRAEHWMRLNAKYRPLVEAARARTAA